MDPCLHPLREKDISIHALREEGDSSWTARKCWA